MRNAELGLGSIPHSSFRTPHLIWCSGGDSNPHGLLHTPLKRARLPITPPELNFQESKSNLKFQNLRSGNYEPVS